MSTPPARSVPLRYVVIALVGVAAVVIGLTGTRYLDVTEAQPTAAPSEPTASATPTPRTSAGPATVNLLGTDPPPALLPADTLGAVADLANEQRGLASARIAQWFAQNGTDADDDAFATWAAQQLTTVPTSFQRQGQLSQLPTKASRDEGGLEASAWLAKNGAGPVWAWYAQRQNALRSSDAKAMPAKDVTAAVDLAGTIAAAVSDQQRLSAPHVVSPALRATQKVDEGAECPCSYPSGLAARSAAARTMLADVAGATRDELFWMESQVNQAQLYTADAFPVDISAGSFLGDLVGEYVLVTRGHAKP